MPSSVRRVLFVLFFASGFCGLLYQVVWVRMAFAAFGVITPVLSVVISVFMLGLAVGTWGGGKAIGPLTRATRSSPVLFYGLCELLIAFGAVAVPLCFSAGENYLLVLGESSSSSYLIVSAVFIALSLFPWCVFMGATFPLMMAFIKDIESSESNGFSYLYFANVAGAVTGTVLTAVVLIELFGFQGTLRIAALVNISIGVVSLALGRRYPLRRAAPEVVSSEMAVSTIHPALSPKSKRVMSAILFLTGFTSMAMEVVWTRAFTPILKTTIYAFAGLLTAYLVATWIGSQRYRKHLRQGRTLSTDVCLGWLALAAFLPLFWNDPRLHPKWFTAVLSLFPFCGLLGYLTPKLIDHLSDGIPERAGNAYSLNILGGILGPLCAGYWLLPNWGVRGSLIFLALPYVGLFFLYYSSFTMSERRKRAIALCALSIVGVSFFVKTFEDGDFYHHAQVRRDYTATIISSGEGREKRLFVNGVSITHMTPITKVMAHLPLLAHVHRPQSALVICFGMGTTYRSLLSWDLNATAVELVPSVRDAFGYYFEDAPALLQNTKGKIVIDDGRRYLKRTKERFDVVTLDPPPPVEAAGSSMLYSTEFYSLLKERLNSGGIVQQWVPGGEDHIVFAVAKSLKASFPYLRVFRGFEGFGYHFLASESPIASFSVEEAVKRLPEKAARDLIEWGPPESPKELLTRVLSQEIPIELLTAPERLIVTDDRPVNEYFLFRRAQNYFRGRFRNL